MKRRTLIGLLGGLLAGRAAAKLPKRESPAKTELGPVSGRDSAESAVSKMKLVATIPAEDYFRLAGESQDQGESLEDFNKHLLERNPQWRV